MQTTSPGQRSELARARPVMVQVRERGRITLPVAVRERLGLGTGDAILVVTTDLGVELVPLGVVPRDQIWTCLDPVRRGLSEAEGQLAALDVRLDRARRPGADRKRVESGRVDPKRVEPNRAEPTRERQENARTGRTPRAGGSCPRAADIIVTRRFRVRYERLPRRQRAMCRAALRRLRRDPASPALRERAVPGPDEIREARFGYQGKLLYRRCPSGVELLDLYTPRELATLRQRCQAGLPHSSPDSGPSG